MLTQNHKILTAEVQSHIQNDQVIQGTYWDGHKGCFIGCLAHSSDPSVLETRFGIPTPLVNICESIFERLPKDEAVLFFAAIPDAVGRDGKDLSLIQWKFLGRILCDLPEVPDHIQKIIDPVITGMNLMASGKDWPDAANAARAAYVAAADAAYVAAADAAYVARAAEAAADAAEAAADAAAYATANAAAYAAAYVARAADAAADAAARQQGYLILELIRDA